MPFQGLEELVVIRKKEKIKTQFAFETLTAELRLHQCRFERRRIQEGTRDRLRESILRRIRKTNRTTATSLLRTKATVL